MDTSIENVTFGFLLPILLIMGSVYWTLKISYSKRFTPTIILVLLAILVFLIPLILAFFDVVGGGFGTAFLSLYLSIAFVFGSLVNLIVIFTIKKK